MAVQTVYIAILSRSDYYNYAVLDLVDRTLSTLHGKLIKKKWEEAYYYLEALTVFQEFDSSWPSASDVRTSV